MATAAEEKFADLERHLVALGAEPGEQVSTVTWSRLALDDDAHVPDCLRWLLGRFAGSSFSEGAYYRDPLSGKDVVLGWLLTPEELEETYEDTRESLPADVVPIENDGGDNHLAVGTGSGNSGQVFLHTHDAPLDANLRLIDSSLEHFLSELHRSPTA